MEADDVIGTFARIGERNGFRVVIATSDKDFAQLVNEQICLVNTFDDSEMDIAGVQEKFGVRPEQIIDYLALIGDKVDNVPGVDKVGPKTAVKWLDAYGDLDAIMAAADEVKGKVGENLRDALDFLPLARDLVTIRTNLAIDEQFDDLEPHVPNLDRVKASYQQLEFKTWLRELLAAEEASPADESGRADGSAAAKSDASDYALVLTQADLEDWVTRCKQAELLAFDTETTSLNYIDARVVGISVAVTPGEAAYIPFGHDYAGAPDQLSEADVLAAFKPLLEDPDLPKVGHNLKYDCSVIANHDVRLEGITYDTMIESYVFNSGGSRHDFDTAVLKYLGRDTIHFEDVAGKGKNQLTFNEVPLETAAPYAAEDADLSLQLHHHLLPRIEDAGELSAVMREIEIPLIPVLSRMERTGVKLDSTLLHELSDELSQRVVELEAKAHELAGSPFNLGSPKQLQKVLYEDLGLPVTEKTKTGQPSTAEAVLQELAHEYELPQVIIEYRGLSKLKSTYADALPRQINATTGRVHTSYHQAVAATGRLSSSDPNLQNIPIRTEQGRRIRQAFIAPPGQIMVAADYSQIELRIMAHLSQDAQLLDAFAKNKDVHQATAAEVFGAKEGEVDAEQRRAAKAINFGLIYGMSAFGLARQLGIERDEARDYIERYFDRYPGVKTFMDQIKASAHDHGYVETVFGRRLYLPDINSRNAPRRQYAERTAINAPMQGTAADIIKRAMITIDRWIEGSSVPARMIMQVHDELVFEIKEDSADAVIDEISHYMSSAAALDVPLLVDVGRGQNWDEAH